jgi:methionyl-tRNA formyltransferase
MRPESTLSIGAGKMGLQKQSFGICAVGFKGAEYLGKLIEGGCVPEVVFCYRQPDDLSKAIDQIIDFCRQYAIEFRTTKHPEYSNDNPLFAVGWQYLFRKITDSLIVFHDSLLPKYRGFAPTVNALISGEARIGVTAFKPSEGIDNGPIISQADTRIFYPIRIEQALRRQAALMAQLTMDILPRYRTAIAHAVEQDHASATYSIWRDQHDYMIDWTKSAESIRRTVDALSFPYNGATTRGGNHILVVDQASEVDDLNFQIRHPGKLWRLDEGKPVVVCGRGLLRLDRVLTREGTPYNFERLRVRLS